MAVRMTSWQTISKNGAQRYPAEHGRFTPLFLNHLPFSQFLPIWWEPKARTVWVSKLDRPVFLSGRTSLKSLANNSLLLSFPKIMFCWILAGLTRPKLFRLFSNLCDCTHETAPMKTTHLGCTINLHGDLTWCMHILFCVIHLYAWMLKNAMIYVYNICMLWPLATGVAVPQLHLWAPWSFLGMSHQCGCSDLFLQSLPTNLDSKCWDMLLCPLIP